MEGFILGHLALILFFAFVFWVTPRVYLARHRETRTRLGVIVTLSIIESLALFGLIFYLLTL